MLLRFACSLGFVLKLSERWTCYNIIFHCVCLNNQVLKRLARRQLMYHSYAMQVYGYVSPSYGEDGNPFTLVHGVMALTFILGWFFCLYSFIVNANFLFNSIMEVILSDIGFSYQIGCLHWRPHLRLMKNVLGGWGMIGLEGLLHLGSCDLLGY